MVKIGTKFLSLSAHETYFKPELMALGISMKNLEKIKSKKSGQIKRIKSFWKHSYSMGKTGRKYQNILVREIISRLDIMAII